MWGIGINWNHVALWGRLSIQWLLFVGVAVVLGWHLGPRPDEVAAAVFLPLLVLIPYTVGCLLLALLRVLFTRGAHARDRRHVVDAIQVAHLGVGERRG